MLARFASTRPVPRALRRISALAMALAFISAGAGASVVDHGCAHHDPEAPAASDVSTAHGAHGSHDAQPSEASEGPSEDEAGHDSEACTCLGQCQAASASPGAIEPTVVQIAADEPETEEPQVPADLPPLVSHSPFFLPPGNGPPAFT